MKIIENTTIYKCDYCKKILFRSYAMINHEAFCKSNPVNVRACEGCKHIEEIEIEYEREYSGEDGPIYSPAKTKGFHCNKLNKDLYPLKALRLKLPSKYPDTFIEQELMPKECDNREEDELFFI